MYMSFWKNEVKGLKNIMYTCVKARRKLQKQCIKAEDAKHLMHF